MRQLYETEWKDLRVGREVGQLPWTGREVHEKLPSGEQQVDRLQSWALPSPVAGCFGIP